MYVERDFARTFANAMREFALSIGKKNFFTFGEVCLDDDEVTIARYVGRDTSLDDDGIIGFDAALDFPRRARLERVCKGVSAPSELAAHMDERQRVQRTFLSSHGDAGACFVTFLETHDMVYRYAAGCQAGQVTLAITCLYSQLGVPCLYYGMEQGFDAAGVDRESARQCLWREPGVFSRAPQHPFYQVIQKLTALRAACPALRFGRQYFRPLTGNGVDFGHSPFPGGVLAYSRILGDAEILVAANTHQTESIGVDVVVDRKLNPAGRSMVVLFSNLAATGGPPPAAPGPARLVGGGGGGGTAVVRVTLRPMEAQILG
jgi:glycosidase